MIEPRAYLGEFWNPNDPNGFKYVGALYVSDRGCAELEIRQTRDNQCFSHYEGYEVLLGVIGDDYPVSLFDVQFRIMQGTSSVSFSIKCILGGQHITSLDTPLFNKCIVKFPYLRSWVCASRTHLKDEENNDSLVIDTTNISTPLVSVDIEQGIHLEIREGVSKKHLPPSFYWEISQNARCVLQSVNKESTNRYRQLITEFAQFLSIALYCQQFPNEVILIDSNNNKVELIFPQKESTNPHRNQLIVFPDLKERVPQMLVNWHTQFQQVAPICQYLLQSLNVTTFDFPDFLIIAHALDGYHKRFVNKKNGKDIRKYEVGIKVLLEQFKDVEVIKMCRIDTEVLTQSRNKYSHLIPDDDSKITKAVSGQELYNLTQKCKVLLTCCILHLLGLSIDEINLCCKESDISLMLFELS